MRLKQGIAVKEGAREVVIVGRYRDYGMSCESMHDVYGSHIDLICAEELGDAGERAGLVGQMKDQGI